jgi:hypothetical protein
MTDAIVAELTYDPARARKQVRTLVIAGTVSAVATVGFVAAAIALPESRMAWVIFAIIFGIPALLFLPIARVIASSAGSSLGAITAAGVRPLRFAESIPWELISGFSVVRYANKQKASDSVASVGTAGALAAGGINDGERFINVIVRDADAVKALIPKNLHFMVSASLAFDSGEPGVSWQLGSSTSAQQFADFVAVLDREANEHNLTVRFA